MKLVESGEITGTVLDVGCGTGENALYLAELGYEVWGVDISYKAINKAKAKAQQRKVRVTFLVHDALTLQKLGRHFNTVIDSGLFHIFSDEQRGIFTESLKSVLRPLGKYFMLCYSDREPDWGGFLPRRLTQAEIFDTFHCGWTVNYIREATLESMMPEEAGPLGWLASITRC